MTIKSAALSFLVICCLPPVATPQTIASKDLPMFVGAFAVPDPQKQDSLDLSKFAEWFIDTLDSKGRRASLTVEEPAYSPDRHWLVLLPDSQSPWVCNWNDKDARYSEYLFYMMSDVHGFEACRDVLTVWRQKRGADSVVFVAAQSGYVTGIGRFWVQKVSLFPDNSLLMHVRSSGGDLEAWGNDSFHRADSLSNFKTILVTGWQSDQPVITHVSSDYLCAPLYRVLKTIEFRHKDTTFVNTLDPVFRIDSASAEVIDLWQLAVQKFGIDTTEISRHH